MLTAALTCLLTTPFAPVLLEPASEGWSPGSGGYFSVVDYADDAGLPGGGLRIEFQREDGGSAFSELGGSPWGLVARGAFPGEGDRWCWRAFHRNVDGEEGPPSAQQCFRTDWTPPVSPIMDTGLPATAPGGHVRIAYTPATDALSGVEGYQLRISPVGLDDWSWFEPRLSTANPYATWLGEGSWELWLDARDRAGNLPQMTGAGRVVVVTPNRSLAAPAPPEFEASVVNGHGCAAVWDAGVSGAQAWVLSFCYVDAGCVWRDGFHGRPAALSPREWVQMEEEGPVVARLAVVVGDTVSPWSDNSAVLLVDRTPPEDLMGFQVTPTAARTGPVALAWRPAPADFVGPVTVLVEETASDGGQLIMTLDAGQTGLTLIRGEGRWSYRALARDLAGNESAWVGPAVAVIDSSGPVSAAPRAVAVPVDGGARADVSWSLPVDALSSVTGVELRETSEDGGQTVISVGTTTTLTRQLSPGRWTWALRGTDALGNVGPFSVESAAVVVGDTVSVGPSVLTTTLFAECGVPLVARLSGAGDAPLIWVLMSGPVDASLSLDGTLTWTPPAGMSGTVPVRVLLSNAVGAIERPIDVIVSCGADAGVVDAGSADAGAVDAGVEAGGTDAGAVDPRSLAVGCGCSGSGGAELVLLLALFRRRRD